MKNTSTAASAIAPHPSAKEAASQSRRNWLYTLGGAAALGVLLLFLAGMAGIITAGSQPAVSDDLVTPLQNNWLVILFRLNAGLGGVQASSLSVLNPVDLALMVLFGVMSLALYVALRRTNQVWSLVAAALPFLGIPILIITSTAGRSGLLVAGLLNSAVMLQSRLFGRATAYVGIVASALLFFAGDIGTAVLSSSPVIALCIGIGYVLWMIWFLLIGFRLLELGQRKPALQGE